MKKSRLEDSKIKESVVKQLAVRTPQAVIAEQVGLSQPSISRFANKEDVRAFIEQEQLKLVEVVPDAVENVKSLVKEMKKIPKKENKRRELSYKASTDVLKSVGVLPTPVQSQTLVNIYQDNKQLIPPIIQKLLDEHMKKINSFMNKPSENE